MSVASGPDFRTELIHANSAPAFFLTVEEDKPIVVKADTVCFFRRSALDHVEIHFVGDTSTSESEGQWSSLKSGSKGRAWVPKR